MPNPWRKRFKPYAKSYTSFKMVDRFGIPSSPISVQPVGGRASNIAYGVHDTRQNKQFLARLWMVDSTTNLKFHGAIDNHDDFIGIVNKIFPPPAGWVSP